MITTRFNITNPAQSGVVSERIFISVFGTDPVTNKFSYLDFATSTLKPYTKYASGTTSRPLSTITMPLSIPAIKSARLYMAIGTDFTGMAVSGPSMSKGETTMYDKIEFDTATPGQYNINSTNVDFYAFSYTMSLNNQQGKPVTVGITSTRTAVLKALNAIPRTSPNGSTPGNTNIYSQLFVPNRDGNIVRFISPKSAGLSDWGNYAQQFTHYLDTYVTKQCFKPGRKFSFYDKFYPNPKTIYYGTISPDGLTALIYSDAAMTKLHVKLNRPNNAWGNPDFVTNPSDFHSTAGTNNNKIDWGFLLLGNVSGSGLAANWGSDPAAMGMLVSICRGVMHFDDGCVSWINSKLYYQGSGGTSTENFPIEFYSKIIHANAPAGSAYTLSYDDVYGQNSSVYFNSGQIISISLNSLEVVKL